MITEDYVNYETAKLLKEKGFYSPYCYSYYFPDIESKTPCITDRVIDVNEDKYLAPTLQMTMKWLREVHNVFICILPSEVGAGVMDYTYVLYRIDAKNFYFENLGIQGRAENVSEISYEEACEAAIKYCLENLI